VKLKIKLNEANIVKKPGLKFSGRRGMPKYIVIHHAVCPTTTCTYGTLKQRGLSTHYEVDKDGGILEYVNPADVAWHAGSGFNGRSIGIDLTGKGEESTAAQKASLQSLVTRLCQAFSIPQVVAPDGVKFKNDDEIINLGIGIVRHRNVKATGCPGGFPMEILGTPSDAPLKVSFTHKDKKEKEKLSDKVSSGEGKQDKKHRQEMSDTGGRFLTKYRYFQKEHPNFSFERFYSDLDTYLEGGASAALPAHGKDYVFGPEHLNAWTMLQKVKSNQLSEVKNIYKSWRGFIQEK